MSANELSNQPSDPEGTRVLDGIIQASAVELFRAHRVAVAPGTAYSPSRAIAWPDTAAAIKFNSTELNGILTLGMPAEVLQQLGAANQGLRTRDLIRELTNQLMGRIKNRLLQCKVTLVTGLPSTSHGDVVESQRKAGRLRIYPFRLLRGEFFVALDCSVSGARLSYSGDASGATEGDIIIF